MLTISVIMVTIVIFVVENLFVIVTFEFFSRTILVCGDHIKKKRFVLLRLF